LRFQDLVSVEIADVFKAGFPARPIERISSLLTIVLFGCRQMFTSFGVEIRAKGTGGDEVISKKKKHANIIEKNGGEGCSAFLI
jgi:hypothetical protein